MDFEEGYLRFSFGEAWQVIKYDDAPVYRERIGHLPETKAVDFIGLYDGDLYLIEVKDFRGFRIQTQPRLASGDLAVEVAQKVRDTLAGIVGAYRTSGDAGIWADFMAALANRHRMIKVVVWLAYDLPEHLRQRQKVNAGVVGNVIKGRLRWLTTHVMVCNQDEHPIQNLRVVNMPRDRSALGLADGSSNESDKEECGLR